MAIWEKRRVLQVATGSRKAWLAQYPFAEARMGPWQFEGVLLLSRLTWGPGANESAHRMLAAILCQIDSGLTWTKKDGRPAKSPKSHPLKQRIYAMRDLPTIEAVGESLKSFISDTRPSYPRFAQFLRDAYLPLVLGAPRLWDPPASESLGVENLLDVDRDPLSPVPKTIGEQPLEDFSDLEQSRPQREVRALAKVDVVEEMLVMVKTLLPFKELMEALVELWRGENSWDFFESIPRLSYWVRWLRPVLQSRFEFSALQTVGQEIHRTDKGWAGVRAAQWRKRMYLAPTNAEASSALVTPPDKYRRMGLFHLRALLLAGRLLQDAATIAEPDRALSEVICDLDARHRRELYDFEIAAGLQRQHPVEPVLERIGTPETPAELISAVERLLPEISELHSNLAGLLQEAYLPMLKGAPISWTPRNEIPPTGIRGKRASRPHRKTSRSVRRTRISIPGREKPLPGESIEETQENLDLYQRKEPTKKALPLKKELLWVHQRIWGANPLLVRDHIESICPAEATLLIRALDARIAADLSARDVQRASTGILVVLTLSTGQGVRTLSRMKVVLGETKQAVKNPRLHVHSGVFELPILRPENSFQSNEVTSPLLEPVASTIELHLPPKVAARIKELFAIDVAPWSRDADDLRSSLIAYVDEIAAENDTGVTFSRIRNFARAHLREATGDMCATMVLCGDSFGLSTAPLYYANLSVQSIEQSYRKAMWPLFGDDVPIGSHESRSDARVGSELLVTQETARALARAPGAPMHAAGKRKLENSYHVTDHNSLVDHFLCMLMGSLGHRPTNALFRLGRFSFDESLCASVFGDKQSDQAHRFRYLPTSDLVSVQLEHYLEHLRRLKELADIPLQTSDRVNGALTGESPLFFHLDSDRNLVDLEIESWRKTLPRSWDSLPLNWGRTWLSSRGREAGIDPDHLSIVLGHLEAVGYPFSRESPLEPAQLSREISAQLGQVARSAGWIARRGLRTQGDPGACLGELGPLRDWKKELQNHAEQSQAFDVERKRILWSNLRSNREEGERVAISALQSVLSTQLCGFEDFRALRAKRKSSGKTAESVEPHVVLSVESLESVQDKIDEATHANKVLSIAAHNALRHYLQNAKALLAWDCPIPSPWLAPQSMEPTPFFPGIFRATAQVRALREHFRDIPVTPGTGFTAFEWMCGKTILALAAFGFQDTPDRLLKVLGSRTNTTRSRTLQDLVLVDVGQGHGTIGIRGLAALAVTRLAKQFPKDATPGTQRLSEVLAAQIPSTLADGAQDLLGRLCATVSVANLVELSGLARTAMGQEGGCVAMPASRQRQFLEEGHGLDGSSLPGSGNKSDPDLRIADRRYVQSVARKQYMQLRKTLYIGEGPKVFEVTGETISQANIVAFRSPLKRELKAFLEQKDLSPLVACIAAFALELTTNGTRRSKEPAWNTVHGYVISFGSELIELATDMDFMYLDSDEYLDLYQDVLDHKDSSERQAVAARELVDFHRYLEEHHGCESVDFSDLEGVVDRPEYHVDADVVQPQEFARGLAVLSGQASVSQQTGSGHPDHIRLCRQAEVFALLLRASGGRHNELAALRFKDILATLEATILLVRPSRYRRLKTSAARRIVDCSLRLSRRQRRIVYEWIAAERARLGKAWKATLPIFSKKSAPKERVASADLRNVALSALDGPIGYRSKIHRVRHLVAGEDLLAIWLSDTDWRALRHARVVSRRLVRGYRRFAVVLPRHLRSQSLRFGHRRSSTTLVNYFHMPWAVLSRPHEALASYLDRHATAVALGVSVAGADKILQRGQVNPLIPARQRAAALWLTHVCGNATPTPGRPNDKNHSPMPAQGPASISARLVDRVLRDMQRGISPKQICLAHGLSAQQLEQLQQRVAEVEKRSAFKIMPRASGKPNRSARSFRDAKAIEGMLDIFDREPADENVQLIRSASFSYMVWANKSKRDELMWPRSEVDQLVVLLTRLGMSAQQIARTSAAEVKGFERVELLRSAASKNSMNHALAWLLVVIYITAKLVD
jgi:hypothetical protein